MKLQLVASAALVLLLATVTVVTGKTQCNETALDECGAYKDLLLKIKGPSVIYDDMNDFKEDCVKSEALSVCVTDQGCESHLEGSVQRFINMMTYLCSEPVKEVYEVNISCLTGDVPRFNKTTAGCHRLHSKTDCEKQTSYLECLKNVYAPHCSAEIVDIYIQAQKKIDVNPCKEPENQSARLHGMTWLVTSLSCVVCVLVSLLFTSW